MTGVRCVADANDASHHLSPSKWKCRETANCADERTSYTVKALPSRKDTAALSFLILQLYLGIGVPWSLIIIVNAMCSPARDSFHVFIWILSAKPDHWLLVPVSKLLCSNVFLLIFSLNFWPCKSYISQVETLFSEL